MLSTTEYSEAVAALSRRAILTNGDPEPGFPHFADVRAGRWTRSRDGDWTGGFFVGELWLAVAAGELTDAGQARRWLPRLRPRAGSDTVFRGFLFWYGAALGHLLLADQEAGRTALEGASALADSFHAAAGLLPLGASAEEAHSVGASETNIDGVPGGTPLLYWAAEITDDDALRKKARSHAARHLDLLVRADGSVVQSATFDAASGAVVRRYTHKGVTDDSTWARAQAWAMLGAAQAAQRDPASFTARARQVCDWWCEHLPPGRVAYWDFDAPQYETAPLLDTSATAIAAAALLKMRHLGVPAADQYSAVATEMIDVLVTRHLAAVDGGEGGGLLRDGCYNHRIGLATSSELVWGTYFLLEALLGISGRVDTALL